MGESEVTFEVAMERLDKIVNELESGDVPLEQAIELFQEGMKLSKFCNEKLEHVERKIEMLIDEDGALKKQEFQPPEDA